MAWPSPPNDPNLAIVKSALDAISSQLSRAEASGANLMVISSADVTGAAALKAPTDAVRALGANLVLTAALRPDREDAVLDVAVLAADSADILRRRNVRVARAAFGRIPEMASAAAASLLDVAVTPGRWKDQDELGLVPIAAYQLFTTAEDQARQPNDSGLDQAIEFDPESPPTAGKVVGWRPMGAPKPDTWTVTFDDQAAACENTGAIASPDGFCKVKSGKHQYTFTSTATGCAKTGGSELDVR